MTAKHKYLSYFWNAAAAKTSIRENKIYQTVKNEASCAHVCGHILFSLIFVASAAFGLRFIETTVSAASANDKIDFFSAKVALAAEVTNKTNFFYQSHKVVNIKPNESFTFDLSFQNIGTSIWTKERIYIKSSTTALKFKHKFWPDPYLPAKLNESTVNPNETGTFRFALQAPSKLGQYTGEFLLVNDNVMIPGGEVAVTLNVVEDPSAYKPEPVAAVTTTAPTAMPVAADSTKSKLNVCNLKLNIASVESGIDNLTCAKTFNLPDKGPDIRVGLLHTDNPITIKNNSAWQVYDKNDILLASVTADQELTFYYIESKKEYAFDFIDKTVRTVSDLKLKNFNNGVFTILSYNDIPSWNKSLNYNQFRGDLKITFYSPKERVWVINTLPLEDYLLGMKETSNPDPAEYQRAMTIAARTYALYHINKFKVEDSFFDVYPDEQDQVYKGYVAEQIMPNQAAIVSETRGVVLTYNNALIVAYYSARSGGQTADHKNLPYLKSVSTPYSKALGKWGHGVGLDQYDAKARAEKLNWTYDQILTYYYSNVSIEKIY